MTTFNTGNPIGSFDTRDRADNSQNLDLAVNSPLPTFVDRLGTVRLTLAGMSDAAGDATLAIEAAQQAITAAFQAQAAAAEAAETSEATAANAAALATAQAAEYALEAAESAATAQAAADSALLSGNLFPTTAAGIAATTSGDYFSVPSAESTQFIDLYRNNSGAALLVSSYPSKRFVEDSKLTSGEQLGTLKYQSLAQAFNGASILNSGFQQVGINIPSGNMGNTSYVVHFIALDLAARNRLAGSTVRIKLIGDSTANFLPEKVSSGFVGQVTRAGVGVSMGTLITNSQVGTRFTREISYTITSADERIGVGIQIQGGSGTTGHFYRASSLSMSIVSWSGVGTNSSDYLLEANRAPYVRPVLVRADGTGDYLTPLEANTAITTAGETREWEIIVGEGTYTDKDWFLDSFVSMTGTDKNFSIIHGELPDNVDPTTIQNNETVWLNGNSRLKNLTVTARNMRYPVHSDASGANKNITIELENCHIEHFGNEGAKAWQAANGGSPSLVWPFTTAWGFGSASGMIFKASYTTFKSDTVAWYVHTNSYFDRPNINTLTNCECIATNADGRSIRIQPLGSLRNDIVQVNNSLLVGDIDYIPSPWIPTTLADQPASHAEVELLGAGNSAAVFTVTDFGRALRIDSATTGASSSVAVSGTAAIVIFGKKVYAKNGATGFKGYAYGWADISGEGVGLNRNVFITSLGKRLGNCTTVNKVLTVSINGGAAITVTFNQDHTNQTNATVLGIINAALGSAATAYEFAVGETYRPSFSDEESLLKNTSSEGIPFGSALAFSGSNRNVRKMTSSDAPSLFAGIAWEPIYPNEFGRVKTRGYLPNVDLLGTPSGMTFGQSLFVDAATPGRLTTTSGANPIMRAIRSDAVEVAPK